MRSEPNAIGLVVGLVGSVAVLAHAQAPTSAQAPSSYSLWEFGTMPRPAFKAVLLGNPAVRAELKITGAQNGAILENLTPGPNGAGFPCRSRNGQAAS